MTQRRGNGEGSISKRKDGRWQAVVTIGTADGKAKKAYYYGRTRKQAQEKMIDALGKIRAGIYKAPTKLTLLEWLNTWLHDYMKQSLRPTTWASYETQIVKHIGPEIGHIKVTNLQTSQLQKLYVKKSAGHRADCKPGGLSPRSVRYIHTILYSALEQARKEHVIAINPASAVKLPKVIKKEMQTLNTAEVKMFLAAAKGTKYQTAYFLELATGLRRGELLGLRWKDVDTVKGTVSVTQGLVRTKQGLTFQKPKTHLSERTISIPMSVAKELKRHRVQQAQEILALGEAYENNDLVFANELGGPVEPRGFTRHFERLLERAGLHKIRFHDMRHYVEC